MWTYRNGPASEIQTTSSKSLPTKSIKKQSIIVPSNLPGRVAAPKTGNHAKPLCKPCYNMFVRNSCFTYLLGLLIGAICSKICNDSLLQYAKYYTENVFNLFLSQNYALIFSNHYLTFLAQFTVILISGFCAFGIVLIPLFILLKGIGTGCFFSLLYLQYGITKGLFGQLLFFLLPELIGFLFVLLLCSSSWKVSKNLFSSCIRRAPSNLCGNCKLLLHRYLILCMLGFVPCVLEVVSSMIFAPLFF